MAEKALSEYAVKDIEGYEGMYAVTNCGRVYSHSRVNRQGRLQKGRWMKPQKDKDGYLKVRLQKEGTSSYIGVHRLVGFAFIPNPEGLPVINHKDEVRDNNSVSNIEWCTVAYNNAYSKTKTIKLLSPEGEVVTITNVAEFADKYGLAASCLHRVASGERLSHRRWRLAI